MIRLALAVVVALLGAPAFADTVQRIAPQSPAQVRLSFAPVVKKAAPAVVNVYASRVETMPRNPLFDDPIFRQFLRRPGKRGPAVSKSLGSGVIVDPSGLVVTNYHVIEGMTEVKVALSDKREFEAQIVLRDPRTDLAVLRLKGGGNFPVLELGDSDALEVGDFVIAIGDPFGVGQTVTQGIVSALARTQVGISDYGFFIQTDAAINPGNSGRRAGRSRRQAGRHQFGDLFALGRQHGNWLRHSRQHGQERHRRGAPGRRDRQTALARRDAAEPDQGHRRQSRHRSPDGRAGGDGRRRMVRRSRRVSSAATSSPRSTGKASRTPRASAFGSRSSPSAARPRSRSCASGRTLSLPLKLAAAPEIPPRDALTIRSRSPFEGAEVMNMSPAVAEELSLDGAAARRRRRFGRRRFDRG